MSWHCCPSAEWWSTSGLCHNDFTLLEESHIAEWGPAFIPSLFIFSWSLCAWLITFKPREVLFHRGFWEEFCLPSCEQMSLSPSFQVCSSCCRAFSSACIITLPERPMGRMVTSFLSWIPPLSLANCCCVADSLDSLSSAFCFLLLFSIFLISLAYIVMYFQVGASRYQEIGLYPLLLLLLWLLTILVLLESSA